MDAALQGLEGLLPVSWFIICPCALANNDMVKAFDAKEFVVYAIVFELSPKLRWTQPYKGLQMCHQILCCSQSTNVYEQKSVLWFGMDVIVFYGMLHV